MLIATFILSVGAMSRGFLDERLNVYQYINEQAMLEFNYEFKKDDKGMLGTYPYEFERLFDIVSDLENFELLLA